MVSLYKGSSGIKSLTRPFETIATPSPQELMIELQTYVQQGILSPEEAATYFLQETELGAITQDPATRAAQISALEQLKTKADEGGLDAVARANLRQSLGESETMERGNQEKIMADARARGMGGSGVELANRLLSQQGAASRSSAAALETASQAETARMNALREMSTLGGTIRTQDYDKERAKAEAQDVINKFNISNQQRLEEQRVASKNEAQAKNLALKQGLANMNTETKNKQEVYNKQVPQTIFEDKMAKASGLSSARKAQTDQEMQADQTQQSAYSNLGSSAASIVGLLASDRRAKKDVKEFNPSDFLDDLVPSRYNYKNPSAIGTSPGPQTGIMAQDLEKSGIAPQAISENAEGMKMIDYNKLGPPLLAALADLAQRTKSLERKK